MHTILFQESLTESRKKRLVLYLEMNLIRVLQFINFKHNRDCKYNNKLTLKIDLLNYLYTISCLSYIYNRNTTINNGFKYLQSILQLFLF